MKRTIKFRAKLVDSGEWCFGSLVMDHKGIPDVILEWTEKETAKFQSRYHITPETVGQFTGLLDKNGKEIYEGDICFLKPTHHDAPSFMIGKRLVVWNNVDASFQYKDYIPMSWGGFESVEIIGNIHENPDLI